MKRGRCIGTHDGFKIDMFFIKSSPSPEEARLGQGLEGDLPGHIETQAKKRRRAELCPEQRGRRAAG